MLKASCSASKTQKNSTSGSRERASGAQKLSTENRPVTRSQKATLSKGFVPISKVRHSQSSAKLSYSPTANTRTLPENNARRATENSPRHVKSANIEKKGKSASEVKMADGDQNGVNQNANAVGNGGADGAPNQNAEGGLRPENAPIPPAPQPNLDDWRYLLRALVSTNLELPEFAGRDHEDPEVFIRECITSFNVNRTEVHARVRLASRGLKENAAHWWAAYKNLNINWDKFCELLRNRYASQNVLMRLSAKLYGQPQSEKEGTGMFLEQRHLLARRLLPEAPEGKIIAVLLEALRGSIKKLLRSSNFDTVEDLISRAVQIEQDEFEERNANKRYAPPATPSSAQTQKPKTSAPTLAASSGGNTNLAQSNATRPLPRCHFCPERHWNRDCPHNPRSQTTENQRGVTDSTVPAAPRGSAQ